MSSHAGRCGLTSFSLSAGCAWRHPSRQDLSLRRYSPTPNASAAWRSSSLHGDRLWHNRCSSESHYRVSQPVSSTRELAHPTHAPSHHPGCISKGGREGGREGGMEGWRDAANEQLLTAGSYAKTNHDLKCAIYLIYVCVYVWLLQVSAVRCITTTRCGTCRLLPRQCWRPSGSRWDMGVIAKLVVGP